MARMIQSRPPWFFVTSIPSGIDTRIGVTSHGSQSESTSRHRTGTDPAGIPAAIAAVEAFIRERTGQ